MIWTIACKDQVERRFTGEHTAAGRKKKKVRRFLSGLWVSGRAGTDLNRAVANLAYKVMISTAAVNST